MSFFSCGTSFSPSTRLKNSTVSSSVSRRSSCRYGGESLMPRSGKVLIGPSADALRPLIVTSLKNRSVLQVVHQVVGVVRRRVADRALRLAEEQRLAAPLGLARLRRIEPAEDVQLRRRREVEQVLELAHGVHLAAALERADALARRRASCRRRSTRPAARTR